MLKTCAEYNAPTRDQPQRETMRKKEVRLGQYPICHYDLCSGYLCPVHPLLSAISLDHLSVLNIMGEEKLRFWTKVMP